MSPSLGRAAAIAAVLMLVAGCSGGSTPGPSSSVPTPTIAETPVATARIDVATVFMEAINDPSFSSVATVSGSIVVGGLETVVTGEMHIRGPDSYLHLIASATGAASGEYETVTLGADTFERTDGGLWMLEPAGDPGTGGLRAGFDFSSLRVDGTRRLGTETLVRLLPVGGTPVTPAMLGLNDPTISGFTGSVEFLSRDDGAPAAIIFQGGWDQLAGDEQVDCSFDLTIEFSRVGLWVRIDRPAQAWSPWVSEQHAYAMAFPTGWEATAIAATDDVAAYDRFLGPIDQEIQVYHYSDIVADATPAMVYQWAAQWISDTYGVQPEKWEDLTVGGLPCRLYRVHYTEDSGIELLYMEAVVVGSGSAWDLVWYSEARSDPPDRALFGDFLSTFEPST